MTSPTKGSPEFCLLGSSKYQRVKRLMLQKNTQLTKKSFLFCFKNGASFFRFPTFRCMSSALMFTLYSLLYLCRTITCSLHIIMEMKLRLGTGMRQEWEVSKAEKKLRKLLQDACGNKTNCLASNEGLIIAVGKFCFYDYCNRTQTYNDNEFLLCLILR